MVYEIIKHSVNYIILVLTFTVFLIFSFQFLVQAKVDIQKVGQDEYDRFVIVENIMNLEKCTIARGIFLLDKIEQDENCKFKHCKLNKDVNFGFHISSEEIEIPSKICKKGNFNPKFRTGTALPILLYNKSNGRFYNAHMLIYGPEGIYTSSLSSTRESKLIPWDLFRKNVRENKKIFEINGKFKCDVKAENKSAKCRIEKIFSDADIRTRRLLSVSEVPKVKFITKNFEEIKEPIIVKNIWTFNKWSAEAFPNIEIDAGEELEIKIIWEFEKKKFFGWTNAFLNYRVICPIGDKYDDDKNACIGEKSE